MLKKVIISQVSESGNDTSFVERNEKKTAGSDFKFTAKDYKRIKKIMVADDDPAIIDVLTIMLETAGYKVYTSANGQTIADVNRTHPDLILLDILMSGISGHDICKQLKNQQSTKHIPVIMISANKNAMEITLNACADDFIAKPFEMYNLLQKVAKHIKV